MWSLHHHDQSLLSHPMKEGLCGLMVMNDIVCDTVEPQALIKDPPSMHVGRGIMILGGSALANS